MVAKKFKKAVGEQAEQDDEGEEGATRLPTKDEVAKAHIQPHNKQSYISSKILNAYKAVKEAEVKMIKQKHEQYEREFVQTNQIVVDETKKPIQSSKKD